MRRVRPGETPAPLSIWQWGATGQPLLVLGLKRIESSWGSQWVVVTLELAATPPALTFGAGWIWTSPSQLGMGPVLNDWRLIEDAPDVNTI